ncbi:Uncharacterised protein [Moraxella bovis]|uniref:Uncharacterized protein n=1 Tax=Moraxella bovis TaxID=476 RepID=A0A378Q0F9_MORBO|nr:Uncharacterised protein [Moraxella bovis]
MMFLKNAPFTTPYNGLIYQGQMGFVPTTQK